MTKFFTVTALALTLSIGAIATTSVPADAAPSYGFSISDGKVNPFAAGVNGR